MIRRYWGSHIFFMTRLVMRFPLDIYTFTYFTVPIYTIPAIIITVVLPCNLICLFHTRRYICQYLYSIYLCNLKNKLLKSNSFAKKCNFFLLCEKSVELYWEGRGQVRPGFISGLFFAKYVHIQ